MRNFFIAWRRFQNAVVGHPMCRFSILPAGIGLAIAMTVVSLVALMWCWGGQEAWSIEEVVNKLDGGIGVLSLVTIGLAGGLLTGRWQLTLAGLIPVGFILEIYLQISRGNVYFYSVRLMHDNLEKLWRMLLAFALAGLVLLWMEGWKRVDWPEISNGLKLLVGVAAGLVLLLGLPGFLVKDELLKVYGLLGLSAAIGFTIFFTLALRLRETPSGRRLYAYAAWGTIGFCLLWMPLVYEKLALSMTCFLIAMPGLLGLRRQPQPETGDENRDMGVLGKVVLMGCLALAGFLVAIWGWGAVKAVRTQRLLAVCSQGTPEQVQTALGCGARANVARRDGQTPLLLAAEFNPHPQVVTVLQKAGSNVNERNESAYCNGTPLFAAIRNPNPEMLAALIRAGANVHRKDRNGQTPLICAIAETKTPESIRMLLEAGADINVTENIDGMTPLMYAVRYGRKTTLIKSLLQAGADVNAQDRSGMSALMYAVDANGNLETIRLLLQAGAEIKAQDGSGMTALMYAAGGYGARSNVEIVTALLQAGAEVKAQDRSGMTVLMYAAGYTRNPDILKLLLQAGAEVNAKDQRKRTALMLAAGRSEKGLELLLQAGAEVNARDDYGNTALNRAVDRKNFSALDRLIRAGADLETKDDQGMTPLLAEVAGYTDMKVVAALIQHGANVNAKDSQGRSMLYYARSGNNPKLVALLLQAGVK